MYSRLKFIRLEERSPAFFEKVRKALKNNEKMMSLSAVFMDTDADNYGRPYKVQDRFLKDFKRANSHIEYAGLVISSKKDEWIHQSELDRAKDAIQLYHIEN